MPDTGKGTRDKWKTKHGLGPRETFFNKKERYACKYNIECLVCRASMHHA